jgi:hypothetical protein
VSDSYTQALEKRIQNLEAWVEVVMQTLATHRLDQLLTDLDEARHGYQPKL